MLNVRTHISIQIVAKSLSPPPLPPPSVQVNDQYSCGKQNENEMCYFKDLGHATFIYVQRQKNYVQILRKGKTSARAE